MRLLCALIREIVSLSAAVVLLPRREVENATAAVVGPSRRQGTGEPPPDTTEIARCGLQSDPVVEILRLATAAPRDRVAEPNPRLDHVTSVYLVAERAGRLPRGWLLPVQRAAGPPLRPNDVVIGEVLDREPRALLNRRFAVLPHWIT